MTQTPEDTARIVMEILADKSFLPAEDLTPTVTLADLGLDSLSMVEAIFAMEEAFDISIPLAAQDGDAGFDTSTIGAIVAGVQALVAQKPA